MLILGIDPGLHTGWALVQSGSHTSLLAAGLGDPRDLPLVYDHVIIEKPVAYPHSKTNPNDLITLAIMVGEYKQSYCPKVKLVTPAAWKGQVPKVVTEQRVREQFSNAGQFLDKHPKSLLHNVSDAIGLAWYGAKTL